MYSSQLQCYTFTRDTLPYNIYFFEIELHRRIVIPHSILSTKVNLQLQYSQNNSDVHWSDTMQCGLMIWWRGRVGLCVWGVVGEWCSWKGAENRYPSCIHPSFNRQTLTTLDKSMNMRLCIIWLAWRDFYMNTKQRLYLCCSDRSTNVLLQCLLKLCYISLVHWLYFTFLRILLAVCVRKKNILVGGEVWCDGIELVPHCTVK